MLSSWRSCRLFLGPGFRLGARWNRLGEPVKTRKKREKTGKKWPRYSLRSVKEGSCPRINWGAEREGIVRTFIQPTFRRAAPPLFLVAGINRSPRLMLPSGFLASRRKTANKWRNNGKKLERNGRLKRVWLPFHSFLRPYFADQFIQRNIN